MDTNFTDIRDAVRYLCSQFPAEYHRKIVMEESNRSGGNTGACHGQMYAM